ncbi:hypothetical protein [Streptomyces sp. 2231.1]|nr:hypothetical protein [Streptomyces sp. 2231.1]
MTEKSPLISWRSESRPITASTGIVAANVVWPDAAGPIATKRVPGVGC